MTHWDMYWFTRLDGFAGFGWVVGGIFSFVGLCLSATAFNGDCSFWWPTTILPIGFFFILVGLFVPTQKEAAAIWLVPTMVNNEKLTNISSNTLSIVDEYTKEYLADLLKDNAIKPAGPDKLA